MKKNSIKKTLLAVALLCAMAGVLLTMSSPAEAGARAPGGCIMLNVLK